MKRQFHKSFSRVKAQFDDLQSTPSLDSALDFVQLSDKGEAGFVAAKEMIVEMVMDGFSDIDILITIHEHFSQSIAQKALADCKKKGIL